MRTALRPHKPRSRPMGTNRLPRLVLVIALALSTATCESTIQDDFSNGTTRILLTDAPFPYDRVARVDIFVVSVATSVGSDTSASSPEAFSTFAAPNRKINLLALQGGLSDELSSHSIPRGAIKSVRLIIDTDQSSITLKNGTVLTGSSTPGIAWQSSAGRPVLNAEIQDGIVIPEGGTDIVIDFDVGRTFIDPADVSPPSGQQGYIFSPVLRAVQPSRTGSVSGEVRSASAAGPAVAGASLQLKLGNPANLEGTWGTVATARSDVNGAFKFAHIIRTSFYTVNNPTWRYAVVATPPAGSGLTRQVVKNVTVATGVETKVGVVILP